LDTSVGMVCCGQNDKERDDVGKNREMKSAAMKFACFLSRQQTDTLPRYRGSVANLAWRPPFAPDVFRRESP
jgi:hypothetical protein